MKILFYYYYLFYTRILPDDQPYATTVFTLSMSESFVVTSLIDFFFAYFYCILIGKWVMIGITLLIIIINYFYFYRSGKMKEIVKAKPKFYNNHFISVIMTILFFIISCSFMFWGPIYVKNILDGCFK
jgi:hypothetical protein